MIRTAKARLTTVMYREMPPNTELRNMHPWIAQEATSDVHKTDGNPLPLDEIQNPQQQHTSQHGEPP